MLSPVHLRTLRAVIAAGSFASAAEKLGYTASAVSQQMSALERRTGLQLFDRRPRSIRPTSAATALDRRAGPLLHELEAIEREAREMAGANRGELTIAGFPTANARILPEAVARFVARSPGVQARLDEGEPWDTVPHLLDGAIDIVLLYRYDLVPWELPASVTAVPLLAERFAILLPPRHELAGDRHVALTDLRDEAWAATREGTAGATFLERVTAEAGFEPRVTFRSNDYAVIRGLVGAGHGVALVPELAIDAAAHIHAAPVADLTACRRVFGAFRSGSYQPLRPVFLQCLQETCASLRRY